MRPSARKLSERTDTVLALRKEGWYQKRIAEYVDMSCSWVCRICRITERSAPLLTKKWLEKLITTEAAICIARLPLHEQTRAVLEFMRKRRDSDRRSKGAARELLVKWEFERRFR